MPTRKPAALGLAHLNTKGRNQSRDDLFLDSQEILERSFIPFGPKPLSSLGIGKLRVDFQLIPGPLQTAGHHIASTRMGEARARRLIGYVGYTDHTHACQP